MKNCKMCKTELDNPMRAYCSEKCKRDYTRYIKPNEPKKNQCNDNYYQEYTTNYGRVRGNNGRSGGWGIGPNVVWFWTELTEKALKNKSENEKIKLGSMKIVTVGQALEMLKKKE